MRILLVTTSRGWGGMEIYPVRLAAALAAGGHDVGLACRPGSDIDSARGALGIEAVPLSASRVKAFAPDVVDVHHPRDLRAVLALLARMRGKKPAAVFTKHTASPPGTRKRDPYHRLVARAFRGFVTASRFVAAGLSEAYGIESNRIHVVPYGYDPPARDGRSPGGPNGAVAAPSWPPGRRVVGCAAQLSRGKQQHVLVEALAHLHGSSGLDIQAVLAGGEADPGYRDELRALARKLGLGGRVTCLGERRDVHELLGAMDVLVLPSRAESFGIAILEAWSAGVPVIATRAGGVAEFVEDGANGILVLPGDARALAGAIERVLMDPALAATLAERGGETWKGRHTMSHAVARVVGVYEKILHSPAAPAATLARDGPER